MKSTLLPDVVLWITTDLTGTPRDASENNLDQPSGESESPELKLPGLCSSARVQRRH